MTTRRYIYIYICIYIYIHIIGQLICYIIFWLFHTLFVCAVSLYIGVAVVGAVLVLVAAAAAVA